MSTGIIKTDEMKKADRSFKRHSNTANEFQDRANAFNMLHEAIETCGYGMMTTKLKTIIENDWYMGAYIDGYIQNYLEKRININTLNILLRDVDNLIFN